MGIPHFLILNITGIIAMATVLFLNHSKLYSSARLVFFITVPVHITIIAMKLPLGTEQLIFPLIFVAGFLFEKKSKLILYLIILGLNYLFIKGEFLNLDQIYILPGYQFIFYSLSIIFCVVLSYLSIQLFISQYEENRKVIIIKNEMLEASVNMAKKEADFSALLLKEMSHRIKNNLQLIASILNIHAGQLSKGPSRKAMLDAKNRVHSIALIHKQLYKDTNISLVYISTFIEDLIKHIKDTTPKHEAIIINYYCDHFPITVDFAVSVGLIINELVTNSIQHGLTGVNNRHVKIKVAKKDKGLLLISVEDNGKGLQDLLQAGQKGFGFELLETLASSYNGSVNIDDEKNLVVIELQCPEPN